MNSKRVYYLLVGIMAVVVLGVMGGVILSNVSLENGSKKLVKLKLDNRILDEQQTALVRANSDIVKYSDLEKIAKTIVPQDKDQARVVREIVNLANDDQVPIQSVIFPSSNLGQIKPPVATNPTGETAPVVQSAPSQLKAVTGSKGLYQLEITVQSETSKPVAYSQLINFLSKLEQNRRTAQVTNINITPSPKNRKLVTFSLIVNVYIKP